MKKTKKHTCSNVPKNAALCVLVMAAFAQTTWAFSPAMKRAMIAGPWELLVKPDMKTEGFVIPITVDDENKASDINKSYPIIGSAKTIKIEKYMPNLQWKVSPQKYRGGGVTAQIRLTGPKLDQLRWLSTEEAERSSLSAPVGGVTIKRFYDNSNAEQTVKELIKPESIGLISVSLGDKSKPLQFVIGSGFQTELSDSGYSLKILKYVPHYTIDKKTKEVFSQTDQPVNPAIQIQVQKGSKVYKQWLWGKISSPHMKYHLPFKVSYTDFDFRLEKGQYVLLPVAPDKQFLITGQAGKKASQIAKIGKPYLFSDDKHSFTISQVFTNTVLKDELHNESDSLVNPALAVAVHEGDNVDKLFLQLNKSQQTSDKTGKAVLVFRKKMEMPGKSKN